MSTDIYEPLNCCYMDKTDQNEMLLCDLGYACTDSALGNVGIDQIMVLLNIKKYIYTTRSSKDTHVDGDLMIAIDGMTMEERALFKSSTGMRG